MADGTVKTAFEYGNGDTIRCEYTPALVCNQ